METRKPEDIIGHFDIIEDSEYISVDDSDQMSMADSSNNRKKTALKKYVNSLFKFYIETGQTEEAVSLLKNSQETYGVHVDTDHIDVSIFQKAINASDSELITLLWLMQFSHEPAVNKIVKSRIRTNNQTTKAPNVEIYLSYICWICAIACALVSVYSYFA